MAFTARERAFQELAEIHLPEKVKAGRWPNLTLEKLPGNDHTLRATESQRAASEFLDRHLEREIARETTKVEVKQ
jgi:hypothetical protein